MTKKKQILMDRKNRSGLTNKCIVAIHLVRQTEDTILWYPDSKITEE